MHRHPYGCFWLGFGTTTSHCDGTLTIDAFPRAFLRSQRQAHQEGMIMSKETYIVRELLNRWGREADPELQDNWHNVRYNIWQHRDGATMVTLQWAALKLDIATFKLPETTDQDPTTDQMLVFNKPGRHPMFVAQSKYKEGDLVTVPEVVDAFLAHEWTPHWMCQTCRKRIQRKLFP
jgi:hypothetical protein